MATLNELDVSRWAEWIGSSYQEYTSDWPGEAQGLANAAYTAALAAGPTTGPALALGFAAALESVVDQLPDDAPAYIDWLRTQVDLANEAAVVAEAMEWSDLFIAGLGSLAEAAGNVGGAVVNATDAAEGAAGDVAKEPGRLSSFLGWTAAGLGALWVWRKTR